MSHYIDELEVHAKKEMKKHTESDVCFCLITYLQCPDYAYRYRIAISLCEAFGWENCVIESEKCGGNPTYYFKREDVPIFYGDKKPSGAVYVRFAGKNSDHLIDDIIGRARERLRHIRID